MVNTKFACLRLVLYSCRNALRRHVQNFGSLARLAQSKEVAEEFERHHYQRDDISISRYVAWRAGSDKCINPNQKPRSRDHEQPSRCIKDTYM